MSEDFDLAGAYASARSRISGLVSAAGVDAVANRVVPATPAWTVPLLIAHLRGVLADVAAGNLEGSPGEAWTAAQIKRWGDVPLPELFEQWAAESREVEVLLRAGTAGPFSVPLVMDAHAHEQDLRGALGMSGERTGSFYAWAIDILAGRIPDRVAKAGLAPMALVTPIGRFGADDAPVTLTVDEWEYTRVAFGRRSVAQVTALQWAVNGVPVVDSAVVAPYAPLLSRFGLATVDLTE